MRRWVENRREAVLHWARREHAERRGIRRYLAGALLAKAEVLAAGRSFSQVYAVQWVSAVDADGVETLTAREVLKPRVSRLLAVLAIVFCLGAFASFAGYVSAALGAIVFGMLAAVARLVGQPEVASTSWRMSALMAMALIPIAGNAFAVLCLAGELNTLLRPR